MVVEVSAIINILLCLAFLVCYFHHVVFLVLSLFIRPKRFEQTDERHTYAIVICARNEENVIGQICDCIKLQDYPSDLITVYVVADNCNDKTAIVAQEHGARVLERNDNEKIGKGYALSAAFEYINESTGWDAYDAYVVIDADNILDRSYISEMNKCYSSGAKLVTGYRNSKNYGDNWISAGSSLWFLRESRQLNAMRGIFNATAEIKGTGFLIDKEIIKRQGGWTQHLLIEDVQFCIENLLEGERAVHCHDAILYDEQPTKIADSWWQRRRWCSGYIEILRCYGGKLLLNAFQGKGFSNYDMFMSVCPAYVISIAMFLANLIAFISVAIFEPMRIWIYLLTVLGVGGAIYVFFIIVGAVTLISEWKRINATAFRKIISAVTFPTFMAMYIPIAAISIFSPAGWKQIRHNPVYDQTKQ